MTLVFLYSSAQFFCKLKIHLSACSRKAHKLFVLSSKNLSGLFVPPRNDGPAIRPSFRDISFDFDHCRRSNLQLQGRAGVGLFQVAFLLFCLLHRVCKHGFIKQVQLCWAHHVIDYLCHLSPALQHLDVDLIATHLQDVDTGSLIGLFTHTHTHTFTHNISSTSCCRYSPLKRSSSSSLVLAFLPSVGFCCRYNKSALNDSSIPAWDCNWRSYTRSSTDQQIKDFLQPHFMQILLWCKRNKWVQSQGQWLHLCHS